MKRYSMEVKAVPVNEWYKGWVIYKVAPVADNSGKWVKYEDVNHLEESKPVREYTITVKADTSQVERELDRLITMAVDFETHLDMLADRLRR